MINKYEQSLREFTAKYSSDIPKTISGIDGLEPSWEQPVWYITDPNTKVRHRYLLIKTTSGKKRPNYDSFFRNLETYTPYLFDEQYSILLKIYTIEMQLENIVNNSRQHRVTVASKILTEAQKYSSLNELPLPYWNSINLSNIFWDFCKSHNLLSGSVRPSHKDRARDADLSIIKNSKNLKMTPESIIIACGNIFQTIFQSIDEDGVLLNNDIDMKNAIVITGILLGLATPSRLAIEFPLLMNQKLKTITPKNGQTISYLDWVGSKGYQDNSTHILAVLAPYVGKAINFFHIHFKPERYYIRYLKDTKQSWKQILSDFQVDPERMSYLDFSVPPNLFTVAYALGFYPIKYEVSILKSKDYLVFVPNQKRIKYRKYLDPISKKSYSKSDAHKRVHISKVSKDDLILNLTGLGKIKFNSSQCNSGVHQILQIQNIGDKLISDLNQPQISTVGLLQDAIINIQKNAIPTFPIDFLDSEIGADLENLLFCYSPGKHSIKNKKGLSSSPLFITSIKILKNDLISSMNGPEFYLDNNIFYKYGFGFQKLKPHSLRHFVNTHAEKGNIPLSIISAWSGRVSVKQTLEYIHTSDEEKADRIKSTLELDHSSKSIRVTTKNDLKRFSSTPASLSDTGVCVQELSVTPCNYINNFLSGCFGCESACYVCGDEKAIEMLENDYKFQSVRLKTYSNSHNIHISSAKKLWWLNHSQGVALLGQLIQVLLSNKAGNLVSIAVDKKKLFITDIKTKETEEILLSIPSDEVLLKQLDCTPAKKNHVPEEMKLLLSSFGMINSNNHYE
ncbi:hypothetical protein [Pseudoalteromonas rhizosphaerae]|uniref:hypothetical protein n=1 Tax=Pseudoalteromonas rhizosphaerae TaxID=2518973 RepID=UPI001230FE40|nr:hypothetical protein [Pseudoalteromonas rhizosphaerae]